jgi:hypothetical protein
VTRRPQAVRRQLVIEYEEGRWWRWADRLAAGTCVGAVIAIGFFFVSGGRL